MEVEAGTLNANQHTEVRQREKSLEASEQRELAILTSEATGEAMAGPAGTTGVHPAGLGTLSVSQSE